MWWRPKGRKKKKAVSGKGTMLPRHSTNGKFGVLVGKRKKRAVKDSGAVRKSRYKRRSGKQRGGLGKGKQLSRRVEYIRADDFRLQCGGKLLIASVSENRGGRIGKGGLKKGAWAWTERNSPGMVNQ